MPEFLSDSYTHDMMTTIRQLALTAAGAEDYELAQQLYAILFELQMRQDVALTKLASAVEAAAPRVETIEALRERERLRLVPTIPGPPPPRHATPTVPASVGPGTCIKCGAKNAQLRAGLCDPCHLAQCVCGGEIRWTYVRVPGMSTELRGIWEHTGRGPFPAECPGQPRTTVPRGTMPS